jgi:hypothetical protein
VGTGTDIISRLKTLSRNDIVKDLQRVRDERERLELEEQVLKGLLDLISATRVSGASGEIDALFRDEGGNMTAVEIKTAGAHGASKRAVIHTIIQTQPERIWRMGEIDAYLVERGIEMTKQNLRVTLRRMAQAGEIEKVADGRYQARQEDHGEDET